MMIKKIDPKLIKCKNTKVFLTIFFKKKCYNPSKKMLQAQIINENRFMYLFMNQIWQQNFIFIISFNF